MKYNNCIGKIGAFVGILRQYGLLLNVPAYQADPNSIVINETLQNTIMADIKVHELNILRDTKNASKSALLANMLQLFHQLLKNH